MREKLKWIDRNLDPLLITILFFTILTLIVTQVILRIFFQSGFSWGEEISRAIYVWLCFISLAYATKTNRHIGMTFIRNNMSEKKQKILLIITDILFMIFLTIMTKASFDSVVTTAKFGDKLQAVEITKNIVFMASHVGYLLTMFRLSQSFLWKLKFFNSSIILFTNERGYYDNANDVFLIPKTFKKELDAQVDPQILKEKKELQEKTDYKEMEQKLGSIGR